MNASTPNKTKSELYIDYLSCSQDPVTNSETSNTETHKLFVCFNLVKVLFTGKSLSEALIFVSTNPKWGFSVTRFDYTGA